MIPALHLAVLRQLYARLKDTDINWALTGGVSFALRGLPVTPNDLDIQTDMPGAYAVETLFAEYSQRKVALSGDKPIRSHFGALEIDGLKVEIMGDMLKLLPDGTWDGPADLNAHKRWLTVEDMSIPVLSLAFEYDSYLKMGRAERAAMLKAALDAGAEDG